MKKTISFLISLGCMVCILFLGSENVFAAEGVLDDPINIMETGDFGDYIVTEISEFEYIQIVAENEDISFREAQKLVAPPLLPGQSIMTARSSGTTSYRNVSWVQSYPKNTNFKAELSASFKIFSSSSFRQIDDYTVGADTAAGSSRATFTATNYFPKESLPKTKVTVGVTGRFTTSRTTSGGGSVSVPGFSISGSTGTTYHFRSDLMTIQRTYSLY